MPIYGIEHPNLEHEITGNDQKRKELLGARVLKDKPGSPERYEKRKRDWPYSDAHMKDIEADFTSLFPQKGENFIDKRIKETGKQQVVLDWGCGKGFSSEEFGKKYGDNIRSIGYSMDSYEEWENFKNSTLIQCTADNLFDYLKKVGPIDLVYSRVGLVYLFPGASATEKVPLERGVDYIARLLDHVSEGGVIAFDIGQQQAVIAKKALEERMKGKARIYLDDQNLEGEHYIYITKQDGQKEAEINIAL
ncbi:hypothetical protein D4R52_01840 [bacterium]|nr:MAG: hypothetical protein D4R52_01840 [bacterium]